MEQQIGPYKIESELGRGGMGVVYRAHDTRLDRTVAVKALPEELARDPARLERFEREAKTLASLNHPNIGAIYGVEEQGGQKYLVLEYIEGETLADRLDRGPLPVDEAVEVAVEIARGLEAAHDAGVIHRDLKPANIKITPDGRAKVLDFGLAKTDEGLSSSGSGLSQSPTMTSPMPQHSPTIPGAILGTAAYMSPEQARGRRVDKRTDIWSFGVILYEILVGISPFAGETVSDSIGAVLHKSFDLDRLPADAPRRVRRTIRRCLERDKDKRYRDIGDARLELVSGSVDEPAALAEASGWRLVAAVAVTAVVVGATVWALSRGGSGGETPRPVEFVVTLGEEYSLWRSPMPMVSPDGRRVFLMGQIDNRRTWLVRDVDTLAVRELGTTVDPGRMALSPDGAWVLFDDDQGRLRKMPIDGGTAVTVCEANLLIGGAWGESGTIYFVPDFIGSVVYRVSADGGVPQALYESSSEIDGAEQRDIFDQYPVLLPGERWVLFNRSRGNAWDNASIMAVPAEGGEPRELIRGAVNPRYLETGHLVYQREGTLFAAGFDVDRLEFTSDEVPVLRGLITPNPVMTPMFDLSTNGTLVYATGRQPLQPVELGLMSMEGEWSRLSEHTGPYLSIHPSHDDRYAVLEWLDPNNPVVEFRVLEVGRDLLRPVPESDSEAMRSRSPAWERGGRSFVYQRQTQDGRTELCRYGVGGAAVEVLLSSELRGEIIRPYQFSSDGRLLIGSVYRGETEADLVVLRFDEEGELESPEYEPLVEWPGGQSEATLSPDDRWMMFRSWDGNESNMFVVSMEDPSVSVQVSLGGGSLGTWDPSLPRLYYTDEDSLPMTMYAVDYTVSEAGEFVPGPLERLFEMEGVGAEALDWISLTADGSAFYITRDLDPADGRESAEARVVLDWHEQLRDRLP